MGKACDQIQMLVDVVPAVDMMGNLSYFCDICFSPDCRKRVRIGGLDSYFQLNQSRKKGGPAPPDPEDLLRFQNGSS